MIIKLKQVENFICPLSLNSTKLTNCRGNSCMAWRPTEGEGTDEEKGYCGMAGQPYNGNMQQMLSMAVNAAEELRKNIDRPHVVSVVHSETESTTAYEKSRWPDVAPEGMIYRCGICGAEDTNKSIMEGHEYELVSIAKPS